jgi:hypothetical protein
MSTPNTTIVRGTRSLVLAVQPGYTAAAVADALNSREAIEQGNQIVAYPDAMSEGFSVLANILSRSNSSDSGQWSEDSDANSIVRGAKRLTLDVKPGFTRPQVVGLLNHHEVLQQGRQIVAYAGGGCEGFTVLADIVSEQDNSDCGLWSVAGTPTPAGARCACQCSCSGSGCCRQ